MTANESLYTCPFCEAMVPQSHGRLAEHSTPTGDSCPGSRAVADPDDRSVPSREGHDFLQGPSVGYPTPRERQDRTRTPFGEGHERRDLSPHRRRRRA